MGSTTHALWDGQWSLEGKKKRSLVSTTVHVNYCGINEEEKLLLISMKTRARKLH